MQRTVRFISPASPHVVEHGCHSPAHHLEEGREHQGSEHPAESVSTPGNASPYSVPLPGVVVVHDPALPGLAFPGVRVVRTALRQWHGVGLQQLWVGQERCRAEEAWKKPLLQGQPGGMPPGHSWHTGTCKGGAVGQPSPRTELSQCSGMVQSWGRGRLPSHRRCSLGHFAGSRHTCWAASGTALPNPRQQCLRTGQVWSSKARTACATWQDFPGPWGSLALQRKTGETAGAKNPTQSLVHRREEFHHGAPTCPAVDRRRRASLVDGEGVSFVPQVSSTTQQRQRATAGLLWGRAPCPRKDL